MLILTKSFALNIFRFLKLSYSFVKILAVSKFLEIESNQPNWDVNFICVWVTMTNKLMKDGSVKHGETNH